jgi:hypothetical protein
MENVIREKLAERAKNIRLYLHAYAFHLNMRYERILPEDLLDIAHQYHLSGVKVHVEDGESFSLRNMRPEQLVLLKRKPSNTGWIFILKPAHQIKRPWMRLLLLRRLQVLPPSDFIHVMKGI